MSRNPWSVENLQWYDADTLLGDFAQSGSGSTATRTLSRSGLLSAPLGRGRYSVVSPDKDLLLQSVNGHWVVRNLEHKTVTTINFPEAEKCGFTSYTRPVWSRDGRYAAMAGYCGTTGVDMAVTPTIRDGVAVIDLTDHVPSIDRAASRITIFNRSTQAIQQVSVQGLAIRMDWGPGDVLYVSRTGFSGAAMTSVVRIRPGEKSFERVYTTRGRFYGMAPEVHPDGRKIALVLDLDNRAWDDYTSILVIDAKTGSELRRLTYDLPIMGEDYAWSPRGDEIYARVRHGGLDQVYAIPLDGEPRKLTRGPRRHFNLLVSPDGRRLVYQTEDGYGRNDIRLLELNTSKERILFVLDNPPADFALGEWRPVRWNSSDGVRPFGFVVLPPGFDPTRDYPMLVYVHGGGEGSSLYLDAPLTRGVSPGPLEWHAWAALGYVVFIPDYRSTGNYGPEVIADRYESGQIGAIKDIEDIVSGTSFMVDQGYVDPSRIAILGHSAGGQRVYILLTRHDIFAAAILNEPIAPDPTSLFIRHASGQNTGGYPAGAYRVMYGGGLAEYPDRYKTNYMFDAYHIKTPTLIMLGNEDMGGVYQMPSEVLFSILRQNDVPTKLLKFVREGHTYSRPESASLAFEEARSWLERYAPPDTGAGS